MSSILISGTIDLIEDKRQAVLGATVILIAIILPWTSIIWTVLALISIVIGGYLFIDAVMRV